MFSVLFPGQGSQSPGMAKIFYDNFDYVKTFFREADDLLNSSISKLILDSFSFKIVKFNTGCVELSSFHHRLGDICELEFICCNNIG